MDSDGNCLAAFAGFVRMSARCSAAACAGVLLLLMWRIRHLCAMGDSVPRNPIRGLLIWAIFFSRFARSSVTFAGHFSELR